jgi:hypothetical protein
MIIFCKCYPFRGRKYRSTPWTMDSVYFFKCKRFRNTRLTVTFGIQLKRFFETLCTIGGDNFWHKTNQQTKSLTSTHSNDRRIIKPVGCLELAPIAEWKPSPQDSNVWTRSPIFVWTWNRRLSWPLLWVSWLSGQFYRHCHHVASGMSTVSLQSLVMTATRTTNRATSQAWELRYWHRGLCTFQ